MDYVFRRITEEDERFFLKSNIWSPFGDISFPYYIVESISDDVKMLPLGGQGIMKENGEEWSEMPRYCAIVWKEKSATVEFFNVSKWYGEKLKNRRFVEMYKIKAVYTKDYDEMEKEAFMEVAKKCFIAYSEDRSKSSVLEEVIFLETEVRWL